MGHRSEGSSVNETECRFEPEFSIIQCTIQAQSYVLGWMVSQRIDR